MSRIVDAHQQSSSAELADLDCWCTPYDFACDYLVLTSLIPNLLLFYVQYHLAKQCFLVPAPNEKLGFLKTPLGSLFRLLFLKYPLSHTSSLSPTSRFDNRIGCACHSMISKTISLSPSLPSSHLSSNCPSCLTILQSTKRRLFSPLPTWFGSPLTPCVWSNLSSLSFLFSYSDLFLVNLVLGVIFLGQPSDKPPRFLKNFTYPQRCFVVAYVLAIMRPSKLHHRFS